MLKALPLRVVVTGASGFIGRRVVPRLVARGHDVVTMGRGTGLMKRLDLFDTPAVEHALHEIRAEALVHLAWFAKPPDYASSPDNLRWVTSSIALARAFVDAGGAHLIAAGTCFEYEASTVYGRAKRELFEALDRMYTGSDVRFAWGRIFYPYGTFEPPEKLVSRLILEIDAGRLPPLREADRRLDYIHADDVAESFARMTDVPYRGAIDLGTGTWTTPRSIAGIIARRLRPSLMPNIQALPPAGGDRDPVVADITVLRRELGDWPMIGLEDGVGAMTLPHGRPPEAAAG